MQHYSHRETLNCPYCRSEMKNNIFKPLQLYNLPITFWKYDQDEFKRDDEVVQQSDSDSDDE